MCASIKGRRTAYSELPLVKARAAFMLSTSEQSSLDPIALSVREREVVDLAVLGHTDEQIAQALDITTSTVNSYWVRIRGKLGQLSRTEIVAKMLHARYHDEQVRQQIEITRLTRLLDAANAALVGAESKLAAAEGIDWHLLALHFAAEAMLVLNAAGQVVYANLQAERLFATEPGDLVGREMCELTCPEGRERRRQRIREFMEREIHERLAFGVHAACFAHPDHGEDFRVTMVLERFDSPRGLMAVVTVKEFLADAEHIVRSLRKPLVLE